MIERVVLVTGGSRGIGAAVGAALAGPGVGVALVGRSASGLEEALAVCRRAGAEVEGVVAELGEPGSLAGVVEAVVGRWGRLDVLVHSAGLWLEEPLDAAELGAWDEVLDVNLRAVIHLTRHALPWLRRSPRGAVIHISSTAGRRTYAGGALYCATKHGMMGFSGSLFEDVREDGIKVCAICPGYVNTAMHRAEEEGLDAAKMIQPADVAAAVRYVVDSASTVCPTEIVLMPQQNPKLRRAR